MYSLFIKLHFLSIITLLAVKLFYENMLVSNYGNLQILIYSYHNIQIITSSIK